MIAVVQRVSRGAVRVAGQRIATIGQGLLVLVGVCRGDDAGDALWLAAKVAEMRIFADAGEHMNRSARELNLPVLVVSQFTLAADLRKGRRPSFANAERPDQAKELLRAFAHDLDKQGLEVKQGAFGEHMEVELVNDGPATFILDSRRAQVRTA